jgi:hypothetical protein
MGSPLDMKYVLKTTGPDDSCNFYYCSRAGNAFRSTGKRVGYTRSTAAVEQAQEPRQRQPTKDFSYLGLAGGLHTA